MSKNPDKHLNLFYSYGSGNRDDTEKIKQLEDNITKSFVVTLMNMNKKNQYKFITRLIGEKINTNEKISFRSEDREFTFNLRAKMLK